MICEMATRESIDETNLPVFVAAKDGPLLLHPITRQPIINPRLFD